MRVKIRMAFSIPKAVKKLEFEFWILELNVRLASSQFNQLMFINLRAKGKPSLEPRRGSGMKRDFLSSASPHGEEQACGL